MMNRHLRNFSFENIFFGEIPNKFVNWLMHLNRTILFILMALCHLNTHAQQDSSVASVHDISLKYFKGVNKKADKYNKRITGKTEKTLIKLSCWENKLRNLLHKVSPEAESRLFAPGMPTFSSTLQKFRSGEIAASGIHASYNEYTDKLITSLKYLDKSEPLLDSGTSIRTDVSSLKIHNLQREIAASEAIEQFTKERKKQLINESIKYIGRSKYLSKINKEGYYYGQSLKNYKELFSDQKKAEAAAYKILDKIPAFKKFTQDNSMLASLFGASPNSEAVPNLAGLQTRSGVNNLVAEKLASGGPNARETFRQNMQNAHTELNSLKARAAKAGEASGNADIPDFKPNQQKTKTFFQRLEFGANMQFAKSNNLLPATADMGLSIGYKLNDKSLLGLGGSYKIGWGSIQHLSISHQGIGLRTFIEWKLRKQFFISGGYEQNYLASFKTISQLKKFENWQQAGLVGITKKMPVKGKLVKNTRMQLLYDFLHRQHIPVAQPFLFRIGYSF